MPKTKPHCYSLPHDNFYCNSNRPLTFFIFLKKKKKKIQNIFSSDSQNSDVDILFISIAQTEDELKKVNQEKDRIEKEKDDKIKELEIKINSIGLAYENVLNVSLLNPI